MKLIKEDTKAVNAQCSRKPETRFHEYLFLSHFSMIPMLSHDTFTESWSFPRCFKEHKETKTKHGRMTLRRTLSYMWEGYNGTWILSGWAPSFLNSNQNWPDCFMVFEPSRLLVSKRTTQASGSPSEELQKVCRPEGSTDNRYWFVERSCGF